MLFLLFDYVGAILVAGIPRPLEQLHTGEHLIRTRGPRPAPC
jgi:hypothetical protein